jgi:hypothetical protein
MSMEASADLATLLVCMVLAPLNAAKMSVPPPPHPGAILPPPASPISDAFASFKISDTISEKLVP